MFNDRTPIKAHPNHRLSRYTNSNFQSFVWLNEENIS